MKIRDNIVIMEQEEYDNYVETGEAHVDSTVEPTISENGMPQVTLYQLNQMMVHQLPIYTEDDMDRAEDIIHDWVYNGNKGNYYMLLCNELSYYTLFHAVDNCLILENFIAELWDVLHDMVIRDISIDDNGAVAIWIDWDDNTSHCFYLFPYDKGVVEF